MQLSQKHVNSELPPVSFIGTPTDTLAASVIPRAPTNVLEEYTIVTQSGVPLNVYVQPSNSKSAIVTYHDIGTNRKNKKASLLLSVPPQVSYADISLLPLPDTSFLGFFGYPEMRVITRHFTVYHICAPGHHEGAESIVPEYVLFATHSHRISGYS